MGPSATLSARLLCSPRTASGAPFGSSATLKSFPKVPFSGFDAQTAKPDRIGSRFMSERQSRADDSGAPSGAMSLKRMMLMMLFGIALAMAALAFCIVRLGGATNDVAKAYEARYASYLLADEIYWDFRAAEIDPARGYGPAIPLTELMKRAGFTELEFEKLNQAERNSNDLVRTETNAMNMVVAGNLAGAQDGANARNLMHGADYHQFKARIMRPLDEFFAGSTRPLKPRGRVNKAAGARSSLPRFDNSRCAAPRRRSRSERSFWTVSSASSEVRTSSIRRERR